MNNDIPIVWQCIRAWKLLFLLQQEVKFDRCKDRSDTMSRRKQYELPHQDVNITPNNIKYGQLKKQTTNPCLIGKIYLKNNISNTIIYCSEGIFHLLPIFYKFKILLYESYMVWFYALELGLKSLPLTSLMGVLTI